MMNRKQRRAAEHAARKAERKAGFPSDTTTTTAPTSTPTPTSPTVKPISPEEFESLVSKLFSPDGGPCDPEHGKICADPDCVTCNTDCDEEDDTPPAAAAAPKPDLSEARLKANAANAQHSAGPKSTEGKAKVSTNAVKTALTGRTVLLPFDDTDAYQSLLNDYVKTFQPFGPIETGLVQSLVDTAWRLERIPGLEYALIENEYNRLGHENPEAALNAPQPTLELLIRQLKEKDLRNLHLQENRLTRRREKELKELRTLQDARKAKEAEELNQAAQLALAAEHDQKPFQVEKLGFEFSTERFTQFMARLTPVMKQNLLKEALGQPTATAQAA